MACLVALALEASPSLSSSSHTNRGFAAHSSPSSKSPKSCLRIDSGRRHRPLKGLRTRRLVDVPLITVSVCDFGFYKYWILGFKLFDWNAMEFSRVFEFSQIVLMCVEIVGFVLLWSFRFRHPRR